MDPWIAARFPEAICDTCNGSGRVPFDTAAMKKASG